MTSIERTTPLPHTKANHRTCPAGRPPGPIRTTGHLASQLGSRNRDTGAAPAGLR